MSEKFEKMYDSIISDSTLARKIKHKLANDMRDCYDPLKHEPRLLKMLESNNSNVQEIGLYISTEGIPISYELQSCLENIYPDYADSRYGVDLVELALFRFPQPPSATFIECVGTHYSNKNIDSLEPAILAFLAVFETGAHAASFCV